jgi:uncharacterized protein YaaW (UPF0174 family)
LTLDELRSALELATEEELQQLTELLFSRRFNPLDYFNTPQPIDVQSRDRQAWIDALEERFQYLAADGLTVLRGRTRQITYRQALIQVCRYLKIPYSKELSTTDIESEIYLSLLGRAWKRLPSSEQEALTQRVQTALAQSNLPAPLPLSAQKDPLGPLMKAGSALAISSILRPVILQQLARQFALHFAKYQVARQTLVKGGVTAAAQFQSYVTAQTARRGMALTAARYGTTRSIFAFLGPLMWTWFLADMGWRTISTNYARIIPTIFTLAQIRLTRSEWAWEAI